MHNTDTTWSCVQRDHGYPVRCEVQNCQTDPAKGGKYGRPRQQAFCNQGPYERNDIHDRGGPKRLEGIQYLLGTHRVEAHSNTKGIDPRPLNGPRAIGEAFANGFDEGQDLVSQFRIVRAGQRRRRLLFLAAITSATASVIRAEPSKIGGTERNSTTQTSKRRRESRGTPLDIRSHTKERDRRVRRTLQHRKVLVREHVLGAVPEHAERFPRLPRRSPLPNSKPFPVRQSHRLNRLNMRKRSPRNRTESRILRTWTEWLYSETVVKHFQKVERNFVRLRRTSLLSHCISDKNVDRRCCTRQVATELPAVTQINKSGAKLDQMQ